MKHSRNIYFILIFVVSLITYQQHLGLNALLIPIIFSVSHYFLYPTTLTFRWGLSSGLWILSGLGIFLWHQDIGLPIYIICALHYFAATSNDKMSFPTTILQSFISFFTGIARFFYFKVGKVESHSINESGKQIIRKFLLISIPLIIFTVFLKLYQAANPKFKEITSFINLDFIEWTFFLYYIFLLVFSFGLLYFKSNQKILDLDLARKKDIVRPDYIDLETKSAQFDWQIGIILVSVLSLLLIAFISIDIQTTIGNSISKLNHSQNVHQGINILIGSIVLVIIIVVYIFRGGVNFNRSSILKYLTFFWLVLNAVLIILIVLKNYNYIADWGLTHKRIGVYLYLLLSIIGLALTAYKIQTKTSISFLVENLSTIFLSLLVIHSVLNWNGIIAKYNLNSENLASEKIDFHYLAVLGPETYPHIIDYINNTPNCNQTVNRVLGIQISALNTAYNKDWTYFLSYTYSGFKSFQITKDYQTNLNRPYFTF